MLSVATGGSGDGAVVPQSLSVAAYAPPSSQTGGGGGGGDVEQAQFEADKRSVYKHPLFPLLALLFERCELATQSSDTQSSDAFNMDIQAFVQHQERDRKPFLANEPEIDGLMIKAIQVLRIHLLELEKVQELCKDFCNRYITCLKGKMQSENLLRSDYPQGGPVLAHHLENNNNNSMMSSHHNSESDSNSPVQYSVSPVNAAGLDVTSNAFAAQAVAAAAQYTPHSDAADLMQQQQQQQQQNDTPLVVVHGSTPLSQIGINLQQQQQQQQQQHSAPSGGGVVAGSLCDTGNTVPLSPSPTTPGVSDDDNSSQDYHRGRGGSNSKQKRGVLPKHATSVMRSWLFQHLVHPYPTEDEKRHIAAQTNLTLLQVNNWFINARRRILQPMLDASAPPEAAPASGASVAGKTRKKGGHNNNSRRFWPPDFAAAGIQPQIEAGLLSSSEEEEEEDDSYGSDGGGDDANNVGGSGGQLVIDANGLRGAQTATEALFASAAAAAAAAASAAASNNNTSSESSNGGSGSGK